MRSTKPNETRRTDIVFSCEFVDRSLSLMDVVRASVAIFEGSSGCFPKYSAIADAYFTTVISRVVEL
jgi:hypothetical protein